LIWHRAHQDAGSRAAVGVAAIVCCLLWCVVFKSSSLLLGGGHIGWASALWSKGY